MPIVEPGSKVLVSGANGYIAMWIVRSLLEKGYSVRGTVRSADKGKHLQEYFKSYGNKFEIAVVDDIAKKGAFDEAIKGVDAILHTASPFHGNSEDPDEYIIPAVNGTVGILETALKNGSQVRRIVVTSSCGTVMAPPDKPTTFSEKDWNEKSRKEVEALGRKAQNMSKYRTSKTLAEQAAWDFYKKHQNEIKWDLCVLNPPFVFGPPNVANINSLNTSMQTWYDAVVSDTPKTKETLATSNAWVDVRDVGDAHVFALETGAAGGERIIISAGSFFWQEWLNTANALNPSPLPSHKLPKGDPNLKSEYLINYDTSKAAKIFGIKFRTKDEVTKDTLAYFAERGW